MSVNDLKLGQRARITAIIGEAKFIKRLNSLGVKVGDVIVLKKVSPFNDPIELEVNGFLLAIRRENAKKIGVALL